ncbi:pol-like protein [Penicillium sp. IBT 31633x]|nr:pol-like protein [Penicillium sp. IBT 31633x]
MTAGEKAEILRDVLFPPAPTADLADLVGYDYPTARSASYKAPGPDGIPNAALKKAIEIPNLLMFLTYLFNECLRLGYYASHFRESTTVILRKPGKSDYTIPKSYRPITLLSTLGKALESVLATRLSYLVEAHALLPDTHVGGRVGRSYDHALHLLLERVYETWRQDEHVATLLTLDVTGAFDHMAHKRLAYCLRKRRIPEEMVRWILSFLRDRLTTLVLQEGPMGTHPVATDLIDELHAAAAGKALVTGYIDDIYILVWWIEVNRLELIRPFAVPPWWQPLETRIALDKDTTIKEHDLILRGTPLYGPNSAIAYTDRSKTENGGVSASAVISRGNATARLNDQDTVYAAELKGILLALS